MVTLLQVLQLLIMARRKRLRRMTMIKTTAVSASREATAARSSPGMPATLNQVIPMALLLNRVGMAAMATPTVL